MKKVKVRAMLATLISALNFNLVGCSDINSYVSEQVEIKNEMETTIDSEDNFEEPEDNTIETIETEEEIVEPNYVEPEPVELVKAKQNVQIYDYEGNLLGTLPENRTLPLFEKRLNGTYAVDYYGNIGIVDENLVEEINSYDFFEPIKKVLYATEELTIVIPDYLSSTGSVEMISIPALECFEVYEEFEDYYLVKTVDYIGYIEKSKVEELTGNFVVIDISNQELRLYSNNEIILTTPVVTGKTSTPSDQGLFNIFSITYNRNLVGPGYVSYVDIMMKYNGGEGLHDAEYYTNADGKFHGWREPSEFGGETYINHGSHGCINMLHDAVFEVSEYVEEGTKVLVKQ